MEFLIIHGSEVIARGITAILRDSYAFHVSHLKEISDTTEIKIASKAILLADADLFHGENDILLNLMADHRIVGIIGLSIGNSKEQSKFTGDIFTISDSAPVLIAMIDLILRRRGKESAMNNSLSSREIEILKLVALGKINKEIADKLFISTHTVISHRKNITEKLGIKTIPGLTLYAFLNGLIDPGQVEGSSLR